jgi:hypothetical protein
MSGPPEEFRKIITDFINDIIVTFPEYEPIINKWWKIKDFSFIDNEEERLHEINKNNEERMDFIFKYCLTVFPERFFEILYQNNNLFSSNNNTNTEFLPGISFKYLMNCDISETIRETIWKYLQLIILSLDSSVKYNTAFSETTKLFESLNKEEFKDKIEETMEKMQQIFKTKEIDPIISSQEQQKEQQKEQEEQHKEQQQKEHGLPDLLTGKLGDLAREIAEETAGNMNIDMENINNSQDVFNNLFKNPAKLMELVSSVGSKLENKIKSGDISEKELFSEATDIMSNMKNIPGMENIQSMLKQMGMNSNNLNPNNKNNDPNTTLKQMEKMKERINKKQTQQQTQQTQQQQQQQSQTQHKALTDEQLISVFEKDKKIKETKNKRNKDK